VAAEESLADIALTQFGQRFAALRIVNPAAEASVLQSMQKYGQLAPLVANRGEGPGRYELLDGFKRFRAAPKLGFEHLQTHVFVFGARAPIKAPRVGQFLTGGGTHGFARARCADCGHDFLIAFSCKARAVCPSCNARRMVENAAHRVDPVFPHQPVRQWVLSLPPDRPGALPPRRTVTSPQALLRTDHASFPASGSSISKAPIKEPVTSRWSSAWSCR
jgi:DNA-directed RNA polymerase subunit RPC12/RpoP